MKIAIASQNRKQVTGHTGRCRKFWIYDIEAGKVVSKSLLELPLSQSFHATSPHAAHPLDDVRVLICGGMGEHLVQRLQNRGIAGLITTETDPDQALERYLAGTLPLGEPEPDGEHRQFHGRQGGVRRTS